MSSQSQQQGVSCPVLTVRVNQDGQVVGAHLPEHLLKALRDSHLAGMRLLIIPDMGKGPAPYFMNASQVAGSTTLASSETALLRQTFNLSDTVTAEGVLAHISSLSYGLQNIRLMEAATAARKQGVPPPVPTTTEAAPDKLEPPKPAIAILE